MLRPARVHGSRSRPDVATPTARALGRAAVVPSMEPREFCQSDAWRCGGLPLISWVRHAGPTPPSPRPRVRQKPLYVYPSPPPSASGARGCFLGRGVRPLSGRLAWRPAPPRRGRRSVFCAALVAPFCPAPRCRFTEGLPAPALSEAIAPRRVSVLDSPPRAPHAPGTRDRPAQPADPVPPTSIVDTRWKLPQADVPPSG